MKAAAKNEFGCPRCGYSEATLVGMQWCSCGFCTDSSQCDKCGHVFAVERKEVIE